MPTDIEIARSVTPLPITEVAKNAGVDVKHLIPYGFDKAKVDYSLLNEPTDHQAKLVLVTAINPTPAGEGKTTTTIGLADGLRRRGVKSAVALREPSLGPVFGVKGGAAGGGWAQVIPMRTSTCTLPVTSTLSVPLTTCWPPCSTTIFSRATSSVSMLSASPGSASST